ncbi:MBL fold metallo-hydrolase [Tabrizicola sp. J26]|uniref:MBL fold metallo-hydrolase n=1 Tax=Alitabrizicola rongguiensis TaxID=2909234 RepID=UPI001F27235B|nr:MBL fold metallo-hydrolase [Tabrizicola rongguiensis]MCF1707402.1 MBL fold metallo-hydrolase [Tabrizicola rongguiensis]
MTASDWFRFTETAPGIWRIDEPFVSEFMQANAWLVRGSDRWFLVDTLNGIERLKDALPPDALPDLAVVLTHGHADHAGSAHEFAHVLAPKAEAAGIANADPTVTLAGPGYGIQSLGGLIVGPPRLSGPLVTKAPPSGAPGFAGPRPVALAGTLTEGDAIQLGDRTLTVLDLPGHSPGSIGLWDAANGILIAGDAIYDGGLVDDLHHSDRAAYCRTMERLLSLPVTEVWPGHGAEFGPDRLREIAQGYLDAAGA